MMATIAGNRSGITPALKVEKHNQWDYLMTQKGYSHNRFAIELVNKNINNESRKGRHRRGNTYCSAGSGFLPLDQSERGIDPRRSRDQEK
jgi:hypothetical protein